MCRDHLWRAWRYIDAEMKQFGIWMQEDADARAAAAPSPQPNERVYFILFRDRVKIGYSTDWRNRVAQLPHEKVLAVMPGTRLNERQCHAAFAHLRETGEWFRAEPDLMQFIDDIAAKHPVP